MSLYLQRSLANALQKGSATYDEQSKRVRETERVVSLHVAEGDYIPQEFKEASIIHLYNREGKAKFCDNHYLLSIAGKYNQKSY